LLILGGISGAGMTTALEAYRPILMVVTFGFLGLAFYLTYRPRGGAAVSAAANGRSKIMTANKVMLWTVTVVAAVFLFCPQYFSGLFAAEGEFTADMQRTVLKVEGMTCPG
jgi:hypothetical protein